MEEEIKLALKARDNAHCKIYKVGVALKMKSGKIYTGCNVDNQGIQSICAERVAFLKAISEGEYDFDYIVVVNSDFKVYNYYDNKLECFTINQLLPEAFKF